MVEIQKKIILDFDRITSLMFETGPSVQILC